MERRLCAARNFPAARCYPQPIPALAPVKKGPILKVSISCPEWHLPGSGQASKLAENDSAAIQIEEGEPLRRDSAQVLKLFSDMQRERLDLHIMFESSGNEPTARAQVLDAVDELVRDGFLQSAGGDFYVLTDKGKQELASSKRAR